MDITAIRESIVDSTAKGIPAGVSTSPAAVAGRRWNVLRGDLHFPLLVLKESALEHNLEAMARWCARSGMLLAPHGKTTLCPQIFRRQLDKGAWGMTVATAAQVLLCARFGVRRILIANQLVGRANIASVAQAMRDVADLEVYCLADSVAGVEHLAAHLGQAGARRPVRVLVEWGRDDWRTGVRTLDAARAVQRAILARPGVLEFAGVEGFEGVTLESREAAAFLDELVELGRSLGASAAEPLLLSAGGTAYLDLVRAALARAEGRFRGVVRSGCYATHDHGFYDVKVSEARERSRDADPVPAFQPALELWSCVQSVPQPNVAILTFGKRDCSHDMGPARPLRAVSGQGESRAFESAAITSLNDQHAFLTGPEAAGLKVGDLVACGISHPCTTIDKWGVIPVVDDRYEVVDLYRTFF